MAALARGIWLWTSQDLLQSPVETERFFTTARNTQITDVYLYMAPAVYDAVRYSIQSFNARANTSNLRVWALDGSRAYLSDAEGPEQFYHGIANIIAFNEQAAADERFFGFHTDIEVPDQGDWTSFHNGIPDSQLDSRAGTGAWKTSQAADREALLRDWLTVHERTKALLRPSDMRLGAAMPSWTGDYFGEPLRVRYPDDQAPSLGVMEYMTQFVDDYVVMSYNTDPYNAAGRVAQQAAYASAQHGRSTRVYAALETHAGVGTNISYGDTAGKQSRRAVSQDIETITDLLRPHRAFSGVSIHDWTGWCALPP